MCQVCGLQILILSAREEVDALSRRSRPSLTCEQRRARARGKENPAIEDGSAIAIPQVGGLHYRYERRAA